MPEQSEFDVRREIVTLLMDKVHRDTFPSNAMMDSIEQLMDPEEIPAYAGVLMEKVRDSEFPSLELIKRLRNLTGNA